MPTTCNFTLFIDLIDENRKYLLLLIFSNKFCFWNIEGQMTQAIFVLFYNSVYFTDVQKLCKACFDHMPIYVT